jgi:hypothetical protein
MSSAMEADIRREIEHIAARPEPELQREIENIAAVCAGAVLGAAERGRSAAQQPARRRAYIIIVRRGRKSQQNAAREAVLPI